MYRFHAAFCQMFIFESIESHQVPANPPCASRHSYWTRLDTAAVRCRDEHSHCFKRRQCSASPGGVGRTITRSPCLLKAPSAWWRIPAARGWSRWDGRAEATFTHIDERDSQRHVALYAQSQLAARRADSTCFLCVPLPHPSHSHPPHSHAYLFIALTRAHRHRRACAYTLPRLPTGPAIAVRLLCIHVRRPRLSLSVSLIWIQNN